PSKQGRKIAEIDQNLSISLVQDEGTLWIQEDAKIQERTSANIEILLDQEELTEVVEDLGSGKKGEKEISTANVPVSTAREIPEVSAASPSTVSTSGPSSSTADMFEDEMMTIAESLVAIRRTRPRTTSVVIHDLKEQPKRIVPGPTTQSQPSYKDKGKAIMIKPENPLKKKEQIHIDEELALRLQAEEQAEFERLQKERAAQEEASNAALAKEFDEIQARIDADHELAVRLTHEEQEKYTIKERARLLAEF
ncbi:hypothetical protein Tco_0502605, partial [Tanacetum coccineum]